MVGLIEFAPKVFGIGLSKTGTTSLYKALEILGFRSATFRHTKKLGLKKWLEGDFSVDYLNNFDAVTDLPIGTYFRELDVAFPNSKFILTHRPLDSWIASIERQFTAKPNPKDNFNRDVRLAQYGVTTFNLRRFERIWSEHHENVLSYFSDNPSALLVLNLFENEAWEELCQFLDRPIPEVPFPNLKPGG